MNPTGLCKCGCGGQTTVPKYNDRLNGRFKGQPMDYLPGHHWMVFEYLQKQRETMQERRRRTQKQGPYKAGRTVKAQLAVKKIEAAMRRKG